MGKFKITCHLKTKFFSKHNNYAWWRSKNSYGVQRTQYSRIEVSVTSATMESTYVGQPTSETQTKSESIIKSL